MTKLRCVGALVAGVFLLAAVVPALAADDMTVGKFVQELARAKQLGAQDVQTAVLSLERSGVRLPAGTELTKQLTEGDVARLSRLVGLNVTTTRPNANFDAERTQTFFDNFGEELGKPGTSFETSAKKEESGPPFDPYAKGKGGSKGKKKGHRSATDPE